MGKRRLTTVFSAVALTLGVSVLSAAPAFAIDRTNCTSQDYLVLVSDKTTCWKNRGEREVNLYNVSMIRTGDNNVDIIFEGMRHSVTYSRSDRYIPTPGNHVIYIRIN